MKKSPKAEAKADDSNAGADKNKDQKKVSTPQVPRKKPILSWVILLLIVLAVFGVLGWFVWLHGGVGDCKIIQNGYSAGTDSGRLC